MDSAIGVLIVTILAIYWLRRFWIRFTWEKCNGVVSERTDLGVTISFKLPSGQTGRTFMPLHPDSESFFLNRPTTVYVNKRTGAIKPVNKYPREFFVVVTLTLVGVILASWMAISTGE